jgi:poly(3-hydroxybutyrate) depolymerase
MSEDRNPATPRSMTLMAGPIDPRESPTEVNALAVANPLAWFENNVITKVSRRYAGGGRRVYPGFLQLSAFMAMNMRAATAAHRASTSTWPGGEVEEAKEDQGLLRRVFRRARPDRGVLSRDHRPRVPEAPSSPRAVHHRGRTVDPARSATPRC